MVNKLIHGFCHWTLPPGLGFEAAEAPGVLLCGSVPTQGQEPEVWACRTELKSLQHWLFFQVLEPQF